MTELAAVLGLAALLAACSGDSRNTELRQQALNIIQPVAELADSAALELDHFGPWTSKVPIEVPSYRGIEPPLALSYSSAGPDGVAGHGWRIGGASTLERRSVAMGTAELIATDRYFLDGAELVACAALKPTAPSCAAGGNYGFLDETFQRVRFDDVGWHVWSPNGTESRYARTAGSSWRWHLAEVIDRNGNRATYTWNVRQGHDYLDAISWGYDTGGTPQFGVELAYEPRPDVLTKGSPDGLVITAERLTSIAVLSHGQLVRAYNAGYETRADGAGSFITAITQIGSNGVRGSDGRYGGDRLPPVTYRRGVPVVDGLDDSVVVSTTVPAPARQAVASTEVTATLAAQLGALPVNSHLSFTTVSSNRDGVPDLSAVVRPALTSTGAGPLELLSVMSPRTLPGTGSIAVTRTPTTLPAGTAVFRPDLDGDGLSDLVAIERQNVTIARGKPDGTLQFSPRVTVADLAESDNRFLLGDFDGDGRTDLAAYTRRKQALFNSGTHLPCQTESWSCDLQGEPFVLLHFAADGTVSSERLVAPITSTFLSRLTSLAIPHPILGWGWTGLDSILPYPEWASADLDGDHVPELISVEALPDPGSGVTHVKLRVTPHFVSEDASGALQLTAGPALTLSNWALIDGVIDTTNGFNLFINPGDLTGRLMWGELNGDGRADLLVQRPTDTLTGSEGAGAATELQLSAYYARGDGTFRAGPNVKPGLTPFFIDTWRASFVMLSEDPQHCPQPSCCQVFGCQANNRAAIDGFTMLQADLNADGLDDLFVAREGVNLSWASSTTPTTGRAPVLTRTLIWGPSGLLENRGDLWGVGVPLTAPFTVRSQATRPFVDARFGWLIADFNVDGVNDVGWVDFSAASDVTVRIFPQAPRADTPAAARWIDLSGEGIPDLVRVGAYQSEITSAIRSVAAPVVVTAPVATGRSDELVIGDFGSLVDPRADGKTDLAWISPTGGSVPATTAELTVAYSRGDGTFDVRTATVAGAEYRWDRWSAMDLDGDRTSEIAQVLTENGATTVRALRRAGAGWIGSSQTLALGEPALGAGRWQGARWNGGERGDFVRLTPGKRSDPGALTVEVLVQTAGGWSVDSQTIAASSLSPRSLGRGQFELADGNGDGLSDLVRISRTPTRTAGRLAVTQLTATGKSGATRLVADRFEVEAPAGLPAGTSIDAELCGGAWMWADLDSDGFEDAVQVGRGTDFWSDYVHVLRRTGAGAMRWERHQVNGAHRDDTAAWTTVDLVGAPLSRIADGRVDLVRAAPPTPAAGQPAFGPMGIEVYASDTPTPMVEQETTGYGLFTEILYASSKGRHIGVPSGLAETLVASVRRRVEPTGDASRVSYSYTGFRYDHGTKRSLGYETATAEPALGSFPGPRHSLRMSQRSLCAGRPVLEQTGEGALPLTERATSYEESVVNGNRICVVSAEINTQYDHGGAPRVTRTRYDRDGWGNTTTIWDDGQFADANRDGIDDLPDDNRRTRIDYVPALAPFLIAFPSQTRRFGHLGQQLGAERFSYDGAGHGVAPTVGNPTRREEWEDQSRQWLGTTMSYWPGGAVHRTEGPTGIWQETDYDAALTHYPEKLCNAKHCSQQRWNQRLGKLEQATDPNGEITTYFYDGFGRQVRTVFHDGACLLHAWGNLGDPRRQYSFEGVCSKPSDEVDLTRTLGIVTYFDGMMRPWRQVRQGRYERNLAHWGTTTLIRSADSWHAVGGTAPVTELFYDWLGRPVRTVNPDRSERQLGYWPGLVASQDENGNLHELERDARGQLRTAREWYFGGGWVAQEARYEYDELDRLVTATDALGGVTKVSYSSLGWQLQTCDPDRGCLDRTYRDDGRLDTQRDARGLEQKLRYDALGRLVSRTTDRGGVTVELEHNDWDVDPRSGAAAGFSLGRIVRASDEAGTTSYEYDLRGRPGLEERCTTALGATECARWQTQFDLVGRRALVRYPDARGQLSPSSEDVEIKYDALGRAARVASPLGVYVEKATYDASDRLDTATLGNGVVERYHYDPDRTWLTAIDVVAPKGDGLDLTYAYDPAGRPVHHTWIDPQQHELAFTYDSLDRLTEISGELIQKYSYDEVGRITSTSKLGRYVYGASPAHGVVSAGPVALAYDASGNATSVDQSTLEWDEDGRLVRGSSPSGSLAWGYTAGGDRVFKVVSGRPTYYFGGLLELDPRGQKQLYKLGDKVVAERRGAAVQWLHSDLVASTRAISDDSGAITTRFDYEPFGQEYRVGSPAPTFGYGGHRFDEETNLNLLGARYYHPGIARFISADSILPDLKNPQAHDRYAYAYNSPVRLVDPSGHAPVEANAAQQQQVKNKQQEEPKPQEPLHEFCRTHPEDKRCASPGGVPEPVQVKTVDPKLAALAIHNRQTKKGQDDAERWEAKTAAVSFGTKLWNLINEGTWTEQVAYEIGEKTGFNSLTRAASGENELSQKLSTEQRIDQAVDGTGKLIETTATVITVVEAGTAMLSREAVGAAVQGGERQLLGEGAGGGGCFAAGTPVLTPVGLRSIEEIVAGDTVLAYDRAAGALTERSVLATSVHQAATLPLELRDASGQVVAVHATAEHPFLLCDHRWMEASLLHVGDCLTTTGAPATVVAVGALDRSELVYNFEVAVDHDYFVTEATIAVHNISRLSAPAREAEVIPNKAVRLGGPINQEEAVERAKNLGDVMAKDRQTACTIAGCAGNGPPIHHDANGLKNAHYHPTVDGVKQSAHVMY